MRISNAVEHQTVCLLINVIGHSMDRQHPTGWLYQSLRGSWFLVCFTENIDGPSAPGAKYQCRVQAWHWTREISDNRSPILIFTSIIYLLSFWGMAVTIIAVANGMGTVIADAFTTCRWSKVNLERTCSSGWCGADTSPMAMQMKLCSEEASFSFQVTTNCRLYQSMNLVRYKTVQGDDQQEMYIIPYKCPRHNAILACAPEKTQIMMTVHPSWDYAG